MFEQNLDVFCYIFKPLLTLFVVLLRMAGTLHFHNTFHIIKAMSVILFRQNRLFFFFAGQTFLFSVFIRDWFGGFFCLVGFSCNFSLWLVYMNSVLKSRSIGPAKPLPVQGKFEKLLHISNL